jgi:phytoene synthase
MRPLFLPLAIVKADLTRLSRADNDPFVPHFRSRFSTLWVTWRASRSTLFKGNR